MIEVIESPIFNARDVGYRKGLILVLSESLDSRDRAEVLVFETKKVFKGRNQKRWKLLEKIRKKKIDYIVKLIPIFRLRSGFNFPKYKLTADEFIELGNIESQGVIDRIRSLEKEKS